MRDSIREILEYLKQYGDRLDQEIALSIGMSLANVRFHLSALSAQGEIFSCHSVRFERGRKIEGIRCRLAGFIPPGAPGNDPMAF